jgi:hypothetical protein
LLKSPLAQAFQDGCLVILSIGKKSWKAPVDEELLGVEKVDDNIDLGKLNLLPKESLVEINRIESKARSYLDSQSVAFGSQTRANFRFVREALMIDTLICLANFKARYFEEVDKMLAALPKHREEMKTKYPEQWETVSKFHALDDKAIRAKYYFTVESMAMAMPKTVDGMGLDELLARQQVKGVIDAEYRVKAEEVLREQRVQAQTRMTEFVETSIRGWRGEVAAAFSKISDKIKEGKPITKTNSDSISRVIASVRNVDFLNDNEFQAKLNSVQALVDKTGNLKDNSAATQALQSLLTDTLKFVNDTTDNAVAVQTSRYFARNLRLD